MIQFYLATFITVVIYVFKTRLQESILFMLKDLILNSKNVHKLKYCFNIGSLYLSKSLFSSSLLIRLDIKLKLTRFTLIKIT